MPDSWHGAGYGRSSYVSLLALLVFSLSFFFPKLASAQFSYTHFYAATPPKAKYDQRIDQKLVQAAHIASRNAATRTSLRCWKFVKIALLKAGAVSSYPSTNYAKQAGTELTSRYGFVRLRVHDPYQAPIGSVIVYGGHGAGHVELRTEQGFASDYRSAWRCRYPMIGVYARISA